MIVLHWLSQGMALVLGLAAALLAFGGLATFLVTLRLEARFPHAGGYVPVAGGRLAFIEAGPKSSARGTVVLLHGASANASDPMEGVGRTLAGQGFHVVAFDRPGFGWSDRLGDEREMASPARQGAAIAEALKTLGIGPAIMLGHSWSGALAAAIALDHPERVAGLVLVAPVAMPYPAKGALPWYYSLALKPSVAWLLTRTIATPLGLYYLPRVGGAVFKPQDPPADYLERSRAALVLRPGAMLANLYDLIGLPDGIAAQAPRYGAIAAPTIIVTGDADAAVPYERQSAPLAAAIPGARLVLLPGVGHMVQYVAAEALAAEVGRLAGTIASTAPGPAAPY